MKKNNNNKNKKSITTKCKNKFIVCALTSWLLCFGLCAFLIISAIKGITLGTTNGGVFASVLSEEFKATLYSLGVTIGVTAALSIIVKDKIEPTVWMINIILAGYVYNMAAVYVVFAIWFIDNYIIKALKHKFKTKYQINKEIDLRNGE